MGRRTGAVLLAAALLGMPEDAQSQSQSQPRAGVVTETVAISVPLHVTDADFAIVARDAIVVPPVDMQALPEPAMLVMMLLGLCVVGYRQQRDDNEPFS